MMGYANQKRGCHFGIAEDRDPLAELQIGGDDDAGLLIEIADQMEQQCATGLGERDVAQLVDDDAVQDRELPDDLPRIALGLLLYQGVDQIDGIEEAHLLAVVSAVKNQGLSADELVKALDIPASRSKLNTQGYTYYQHLGISVQGQSAQDAWRECERLATKFQVPVEVHFQWRDNPKAKYPGRQGALRAGNSSD